MNYSFDIYKPSDRFAPHVSLDLAHEMWSCVSRQESIDRMISAINEGKPAVTYMDKELHERFSETLKEHGELEPELRILCMNMMKQLLEHLGYEHIACALCSSGEFLKSAGIFQKRTSE